MNFYIPNENPDDEKNSGVSDPAVEEMPPKEYPIKDAALEENTQNLRESIEEGLSTDVLDSEETEEEPIVPLSDERPEESLPTEENDQFEVQQPQKNELPAMGALFEYVEMFALSICVVFLIFSFAFKVCDVRGRSMENTLIANERLLVSDILYTPQRGDIIVFHETGILNEPVVKRVIATGGEYVRLEFLENPQRIKVWIYDEEMNLKEILDESAYVYMDQDAEFRKSDFDNPIYVPDGFLFVMGDNRNHSTDSRSTIIGLVDEREVLGKVIARIFPFSKFGKVS